MGMTIETVATPKGYSDDFQYFSIISDTSIHTEEQLLSDLCDFPHLNKIITIRERFDDWLITAHK